MTGLLKRWVKLHEILALKHGAAAVRLPPDVKRIHLDTAKDSGAHHLGLRKFWKDYLPQLKYHNPGVPMILNRHSDRQGDSIISIYFAKTEAEVAADRAAAPSEAQPAAVPKRTVLTTSWFGMAKAPEAMREERVVKLVGKMRTKEEILEEFLNVTKAEKVEPTEAEQDLIKLYQERKRELEHTQSESERLAKESEEASAISAKAKAMALGTS